MAASQNRHQVNTTIEPTLYQKMKEAGLKASYCLMVGIRTCLNMETAYSDQVTKMWQDKIYKLSQAFEIKNDLVNSLQEKIQKLEEELQKYIEEEEHRME